MWDRSSNLVVLGLGVSLVACHIFRFLWVSMGKKARFLLMLRLILVIDVVWDASWSIVPDAL